MDATVAPADIKYHTDIDLLNQCRGHLEKAIDLLWPRVPHTCHKYPYSKKTARKAYLKVIPLVYAQQKEMFDQNKRTCENRIVSLQPPHVRPIMRGKRPNPTEFGQKLHLSVVDGYTFLEQTCWSNYNEGCDLKATVQAYYNRFGYYPESVLADNIYQTRANK